MRQVSVTSYTPSVRDQELHPVFHFPDQGKPRKLSVVGSVLARVREFKWKAPFISTRYVIAPVFRLEDRIVLGTDYMDSTSVIAVPSGWADEARAVEERQRRTS